MNWSDIEERLRILYPDADPEQLVIRLREVTEKFDGERPPVLGDGSKQRFDQSHAALITYANSIAEDDQPTLGTLLDFLKEFELTDCTNVVHLLPFYPWDTDRGFSVVDYRRIEDGYGSWDDVAALARCTQLMFDFVANHASIDNPLIQNSLIERHLGPGDPRRSEYEPYKDFCLAFDPLEAPDADKLRLLARPRPSPVLAPYVVLEREGTLQAVLGRREECSSTSKVLGSGVVWATFSRPPNPDGSEATRQIDLNFANPQVLVEVIRILLFYRMMGATLIRLDAIGYLWKKLGSSSIHERETHLILELIYKLLDHATPETITIAEVNEPQANAFTYLGTAESPEADWVYQFTHFPLALHSLLREDATAYCEWIPTTSAANGRQFITTLGTHDGIGMKPIRGILPEEEIEALCSHLVEHCGGRPNHASLPGGKQIVYEVCTTPWEAINGVDADRDEADFQTKLDRYLAVISLSFVVRGLPALYINGLLGTASYLPEDGLDENRTVNRQIFDKDELFASLRDPSHRHSRVLSAVRELLGGRRKHAAFSQNAPDPVVLETPCKPVVAVLLPAPDGPDLVQLVNLAGTPQTVVSELPRAITEIAAVRGSAERLGTSAKRGIQYELNPFETAWLAL